MEHLHKAYDMLDGELEEIVNSGSRQMKLEDIHLIKEITGGMKNIQTVIAMSESRSRSPYPERRMSRGHHDDWYRRDYMDRM